MAKIKTSIPFKGIRNTLEGLTYYERGEETITRAYKKQLDANTPKQRKVRAAFKEVLTLWKQIDGIVASAWKSHGARKRITGHTRFMGENANLVRLGRPLTLCLEFGMEGLSRLTAAPGDAAGEIVCEYGVIEGEERPYLTFYTRKKENGKPNGVLTRVDAGAADGGSFTLTGLEEGAEYQVYAVTTDAPYPEATMVSASLCAEAAAAGGARAKSAAAKKQNA